MSANVYENTARTRKTVAVALRHILALFGYFLVLLFGMLLGATFGPVLR